MARNPNACLLVLEMAWRWTVFHAHDRNQPNQRGRGEIKSISFCWCEMCNADRFRASSTALHCIALRQAAHDVCLAFVADSAVEGARFLRGGCMHAVNLWSGRSKSGWSDFALGRYGDMINKSVENIVLISAAGSFQ